MPLASTPSIRLPASRRRTRTPTRGFASPRRWFRFIPMSWDALSATSCCEAGPNLSGHTNHGRPKWMRIPLPRPTSTPSASSKLVIVRRCPHSPHWSAAQLRTTGRISSQTAAERRTGSIIDLDWGARPRGRAAHFRYWHTASVRPATQDAHTAPKPPRAISRCRPIYFTRPLPFSRHAMTHSAWSQRSCAAARARPSSPSTARGTRQNAGKGQSIGPQLIGPRTSTDMIGFTRMTYCGSRSRTPAALESPGWP